MTTTPKALPAKVSIEDDVKALEDALASGPTGGERVVYLGNSTNRPTVVAVHEDGKRTSICVMTTKAADAYSPGRTLAQARADCALAAAASPDRIRRVLNALKSLRSTAPIADSLASAGGVEVVAWEVIGSRGLVIGVANSALMRDKALAKGHQTHGLVRQSAHLAALSKEREVADGLRAELDAAYEALARIGDFAHDKSTGPAVPDALWEVRSMAYDAVRPAFDALTAHRESRGGK